MKNIYRVYQICFSLIIIFLWFSLILFSFQLQFKSLHCFVELNNHNMRFLKICFVVIVMTIMLITIDSVHCRSISNRFFRHRPTFREPSMRFVHWFQRLIGIERLNEMFKMADGHFGYYDDPPFFPSDLTYNQRKWWAHLKALRKCHFALSSDSGLAASGWLFAVWQFLLEKTLARSDVIQPMMMHKYAKSDPSRNTLAMNSQKRMNCKMADKAYSIMVRFVCLRTGRSTSKVKETKNVEHKDEEAERERERKNYHTWSALESTTDHDFGPQIAFYERLALAISLPFFFSLSGKSLLLVPGNNRAYERSVRFLRTFLADSSSERRHNHSFPKDISLLFHFCGWTGRSRYCKGGISERRLITHSNSDHLLHEPQSVIVVCLIEPAKCFFYSNAPSILDG